MAALDAAALQQLRDMHMPEPEAWWHLPWGVWLLVLLFVLLLLAGLALWRPMLRRYRKKQHRKQLKQAIEQEMLAIEALAVDAAHGVDIMGKLSVLLRRVAMTLFDAEHVEGLIGQDWIDFLQAQWVETPQPSFATPEVRALMLYAAYRQTLDEAEVNTVQTCVHVSRQWLDEVVARYV